MEKIIEANSWDFGCKVAEIIKVSSNGLSGHDLGVLVKRAGDEFADKIRNVKIADDQIPVHVIAMGSTEGYGPNRNGDGFKEASLKDYHKTFVKYAKHYRHHKNKDPKISYGQVKTSVYNDKMRRVELLIALNKDKEAADKYGGFVADQELETLNKGKDLAVSMACKIAYDVCSGCGNKARTRAEYCNTDDCGYGGCKNNLTKVADDGHILHVDNPHPTFFDISTVIRPADRIAYGNVADYLQKAASGEVQGGAALAEAWGVVAPLAVRLESIHDTITAKQVKLAYQLAAIEDGLAEGLTERDNNLARAFSPEVQGSVDLTPLGTPGSVKLASGLRALAGQKVVLPVRDFISLVMGDSGEKSASVADQVQGLLPGVYNRLIASGNLEDGICNNPYQSQQGLAPVSQRNWAEKLSGAHSLDADHIRRRVELSAIRNLTAPSLLQNAVTKQAEASGETEKLARCYAFYKLAFLADQQDNVQLTSDLLVRQNYIC